MAGQSVLIQGIEFQNLLAESSIIFEPGVEIIEKEIEAKEELDDVRKRAKRGWVVGFVRQLSSWLNKKAVVTSSHATVEGAEKSIEEESVLWNEWEWILSEAEQFVCRKSVEEAQEIQNELANLRKNANLLKSRPLFLHAARMTLERTPLSEEEREILGYVLLDSSKRSKIIADVVSTYAPTWLDCVEELFFAGEDAKELFKAYKDSYPNSTYQKGVVGGLKEAGWQASHGPGTVGLDYHVLGDITWTFWKLLITSVRYTLTRELSAEEMDRLADKVNDCQDYLVDLWFTTIKNSELGSSKEGELPQKWAKEEEARRKKMIEIKAAGVNARYEYKPVVVLDTERKELSELKKFLETSLVFYVYDPKGRK